MTIYPNGEIRARFPSAAPARGRTSGSGAVLLGPPSLSIVRELHSLSPSPFKPLAEKPECPPGYGSLPKPSRFSVSARRQISRAGSLIGLDPANKPVIFLTGTCPGSTLAAFRLMAEWSAWLVHLLLTNIPRLLKVPARECRWLWCWEYQKRGALHWHAVIECPNYLASLRLRQGFKALWVRLLRDISARTGIDIAERSGGGSWLDIPSVWRVQAARARKRPDKYLAKYLSKGQTLSGPEFFPPTRWYGLSRALAQELAPSTRRVSTSPVTGVPDWQVAPFDLETLDRLQIISSHSVAFQDKVGTGITFVFYPKEHFLHDFVRKTLAKIARTTANVCTKARKIIMTSSGKFLNFIKTFPDLKERLLMDLGLHDAENALAFWRGDAVSEIDIYFCDKYAEELLFRSGLTARGTPPERSGAGLPRPQNPTLDPREGENPYGVQLSLVP